MKTHRKTHGNTVHLTHASTWRPHSPPPSHTKRKHPAGAPPNPQAKKPLKITNAPPTPHQTHLPSEDKDKQAEATLDFESHLIATHQPLADSSNLIVQLPLSPCDFNGSWSTSSYTTATITSNTCELFQSFICTPNWRTCFGELGTCLYVGTLSDDGRVIRWNNGNTWIRLDSLCLAVKQHCDPDSHSREDQPERGHYDLTKQHPLPNHPQHHTPHRAIGVTHASTKPNKTNANTRPPDTPHSKKPPLHSATLTAKHPTTIMKNRAPEIGIGAYNVLGRQLTFTPKETWAYKTTQPNRDMVILDCTTLKQIHDPSSSVHGSTKDIYAWLGKQEITFPPTVKQTLQQEGDAALHTHDHKGQPILIIHVINPDFRESAEMTCKTAIERITEAFSNIFSIFLGTGKQHLRLQPIAKGLHAGTFGSTLPTITVAAISAAFLNLAPSKQKALSRCNLELCVTYLEEHKHYTTAFKDFGSKTYTEQIAAAQQQFSTKQQHKHTPAKPQWHRDRQFIYLSTTSTPPPQYHQI